MFPKLEREFNRVTVRNSMAATVENLFGDSDSEGSFDGLNPLDIEEVDPSDLPTFDMIALDNDSAIEDDLRLGWMRNQAGEEICIPPFTGDPSVKVNIAKDATHLEYFNLFMNDDVFSDIAMKTNRYQTQRRQNRGVLSPFARMQSWKETSQSEIKQFIGLVIVMGLIDRESLSEYWTTDPIVETLYFGKTISRDRFMNILTGIAM